MKWQYAAVAVVAVVILVAAMNIGITPREEAPVVEGTAGRADFLVRTLDGKSLSYNDFAGKPLIVDFWATWCGPCRFAMPHLDALEARHADDGLRVVGVSVDDVEPRIVQKYVDKLGVDFQIAMASEQILTDFGPLNALPTTFFINREGEIVRRVVGYIDEETLEAYAQEILK